MTTVLLAENDEKLAEDYTTSLRDAGFVTYHVSSGSKIEEAIREYNPEIIISDTCLPEENGDEVCKRLKRSGIIPEDIMVLAMSSLPSSVLGWDGTAYTFIPKDRLGNTGNFVTEEYDKFQRTQPGKRRPRLVPDLPRKAIQLMASSSVFCDLVFSGKVDPYNL